MLKNKQDCPVAALPSSFEGMVVALSLFCSSPGHERFSDRLAPFFVNFPKRA